MSDNWLQYVPRDPSFQPAPQASERAASLLAGFLPAAEEVRYEFYEEVTFFHPGANWSGVQCPSCGSDVENWWNELMEAASSSGFINLECVTPCCVTSTALPKLRYVWPAAFGKFVIEAMNPNVRSLSPENLEQLQTELGCELTEIALHI